MTRPYKINAWIDASDKEKLGMYVVDFFWNGDEILSQEYASMEEAGEVAHVHYKGPDIDGIGCLWDIEPTE